ncbi:MAG: hypothetical protein IPP29_19105 [Bacteroidetes bacterium]|nr:hypothetical protein [Bacteroidota bacterium]
MNVLSVVTDNKYVWIGHTNGLSRLEIATENITHYDTSNSDLPFNRVSKLAFDNNNDLWLCGRNEIAKLSNGVYSSMPNNLMPGINMNIEHVKFDNQNNLWMAFN